MKRVDSCNARHRPLAPIVARDKMRRARLGLKLGLMASSAASFLLLSVANSSGAVVNGIFDISGTTAGASITSLSGTGTVFLGAQTLTLTNASDIFSGVIQDGGSFGGTGGGLTIAAGKETLTGTNTFTGPTTIDSGAFLLLSGAGSIANSSGVFAAGTFDISGTTAGTSITSLSGSGTVSLGAQTLTLTNASGLFSGVMLDGGAGGGLTIAAGKETLTGTNTFTGPTTIAAGATLQLGNGGTTGSVAGNIVDNGLVLFNYSGPVTVANSFSGAGSAEVVAGTAVVTGASSIGGTVTIDPGATMQWGAGNPAFLLGGSAGGNGGVVDNGSLVLNFGDGSVAGSIPISGAGSVTLQSGVLNNAGVSTYTGATTIDSGALLLLIGNGSIATSSGVFNAGTFDISGTAGGTSITSLSGSGAVSLGAQTLTLTNASGLFSGVMQGTGGGLTIAAGKETLTGTNTFTGPTTIAAGATLQLGNGGTTGSVAGKIVDNGTLIFNRSNSDTFAGAISGSGALQQNGTGTTILIATNVYTGATTISGGTLEVDGAVANTSGVTVNSGGTLSGTGIVDPVTTTIMSGGTLAPGNAANPTGTLTITGNLAFQPGSTYLVAINPTQTSLTSVTGAVTINGGNVVIDAVPGLYKPMKVAILTSSGALTGMFNPAITFVGPFKLIDPVLTYDAHDVFLSDFGTGFTVPANAPLNAQNVANEFNTAILAGANVPAGFQNLSNLSGTALNNAVNQLAGQTQGAFVPIGINAGTQFLSLMLNPYVEGRGSFATLSPPLAYAQTQSPPSANGFSVLALGPRPFFEPSMSIWASAYGGDGRIAGSAFTGATNTNSQIYGVATGLDYRLAPDTLVGLALGGGGTAWQLGQGFGNGHSDMFQAGLYSRHELGPVYVAGALSYSQYDATTNRNVTLAGFDSLQTIFDANLISARAEGGYRLSYGAVNITPYGALQTQELFLPATSEFATLGSSQFALSSPSQNFNATRTEIGAWFDSDTLASALGTSLPQKGLTLYGRLAWAHDFDNEGISTAFFQSLPGSAFLIDSSKPAHDSALVTAGFEYKLIDGWSVLAKFDGEFSPTTTIFSGTGTIRKVW